MRLLGTVRFAPVRPILAVLPGGSSWLLGTLGALRFALNSAKLSDLWLAQALRRDLQNLRPELIHGIRRRTDTRKLSNIPDWRSRKRPRAGLHGSFRSGQQVGQFDPEQSCQIGQRRPTRHLPARRPLPHRLLRRPQTFCNVLLPDAMHAHQAMKVVCEIRIASRHQRQPAGASPTSARFSLADSSPPSRPMIRLLLPPPQPPTPRARADAQAGSRQAGSTTQLARPRPRPDPAGCPKRCVH